MTLCIFVALITETEYLLAITFSSAMVNISLGKQQMLLFHTHACKSEKKQKNNPHEQLIYTIAFKHSINMKLDDGKHV